MESKTPVGGALSYEQRHNKFSLYDPVLPYRIFLALEAAPKGVTESELAYRNQMSDKFGPVLRDPKNKAVVTRLLHLMDEYFKEDAPAFIEGTDELKEIVKELEAQTGQK